MGIPEGSDRSAEYSSIDKTDWFINKMQTDSYTRKEMVEAAMYNFPGVSKKTIEGTIGQYWSDSFNPKWSTWKAIRSRGLKTVQSGKRRRIVDDIGTDDSAL